MRNERPRVIVDRRGDGHGCIITIILLIIAWPLAILYWLARLLVWALRAILDLLTLGFLRRRR
jgi:hypothetical protein